MSHDEFQKQEGRILTPSFFVLLVLVLIGVVLLGVRAVKGLGAVSNLSDGYPWGIWITYDVATGTAIACGGYAVAILVYLRNHLHYHPLIRSCVLTSLFGYGLAGLSVMVDLGRPWNAYNFFLPSRWQFNSVMFEVALCVMAYTTVLLIEFLPAVLISLETTRWRRLRWLMDWLHPRLVPDRDRWLTRIDWVRSAAAWLRPRLDRVLIFIIVLGITLPTMHQSSLGSMMLIAATKLHVLWHTPLLPLLFLINCLYIGLAIAILESLISSRAFGRPLESVQLAGLAGVVPWLAGVWLALVVGDLAWRGHLATAVRLDRYSLCFLAEVVLLGAGSLLLGRRRGRSSPRGLFVAAVLIVAGGALYRFNVYLIGFNPGPGWRYFPSLAELMITVSIVAFEVLCYQVLVKLVPVLPRLRLHGHPHRHGHGSPAVPGHALASRPRAVAFRRSG